MVSDVVKGFDASQARFTFSDGQLLEAAAHPTLVLAQPPRGIDGCGTWTLPGGPHAICG